MGAIRRAVGTVIGAAYGHLFARTVRRRPAGYRLTRDERKAARRAAERR